MKRFYPLLMTLATVFLIPGCIEVENEFIINPDGSGKVKHHVLFSPMQMKLGGETKKSSQEQLKRRVKNEIAKSKGVDAWKNVSYEARDDGTFSFTGVAYFQDINALDFHNQGFSGPLTSISMTENSNGVLSFEMKLEEQGAQQESENPNSDLTQDEIQKKIEKQRQQFQKMKPMLSSLEDVRIANIFNLPAPVQSSTNVELASPKRAGVFVSGEDIVSAMETMISSDEMMRQQVKQGKGLKEPPANAGKFNKILFGEQGPVKFTISRGGNAQFDYDQEVRQARKETKKLRSELDITAGASGPSIPGETGNNGGARPKPDVDGGKYGFAAENQNAMKANWGIAFLNEEKNELVLGFYSKTPDRNIIKNIIDKRGLFVVLHDLKKPFIEVTFRLKEGASFSGDAVKGYSMAFLKFSKDSGPMTLNRSGAMMDDVQIKLDGSLRKGGQVKGNFKGSQKFDFKDRNDTYTWDLKFDLPIR